jgi:hypothetical protein
MTVALRKFKNMRKVVVKDYDLIERELTRLRDEDQIDEALLNQDCTYAITGNSSEQNFMMSCDVKVLSAQLVKYFELTNKNFTFESFYDKKFMDLFKALVKDEDEFEKFLDMIGIDVEDFIHISVHIAPQCFTSNLIKYLKQTYINNGKY